MGIEEAKSLGLYRVIGEEVDDAYIEELKKLVIHPEVIKRQGKDMKIVYTPSMARETCRYAVFYGSWGLRRYL